MPGRVVVWFERADSQFQNAPARIYERVNPDLRCMQVTLREASRRGINRWRIQFHASFNPQYNPPDVEEVLDHLDIVSTHI